MKSRQCNRAFGVIMACIALLAPLPASAAPSDSDTALYGFISTVAITETVPSTTTSLLLTGAGSVVIIVLLSVNARNKALQAYLNENSRDVAQDMAIGQGNTIEDLSLMFGVSAENHQEFAKLMRANNHELRALLANDRVSREQAAAFIDIVLDAMRSNDRLNDNLERWIEMREGA